MDLKSLESEQYDYEKEKPITLSGKANLRAKDTCKLGYSCLSTSRCLSFKRCSKHHFSLKQMDNYVGERVWTATHREENCWCAASSDPAFYNPDQKNLTAVHF